MIIYIYSYKNLINGHRYIGKTNNIERRKREHISNAYNSKSNVIKQLLSNGATLKEIKEQVQTSDRTIKRINKGETHFDPKIEYPINKNI